MAKQSPSQRGITHLVQYMQVSLTLRQRDNDLYYWTKRVLQKDPYVQDGTQDVFYNIDTW